MLYLAKPPFIPTPTLQVWNRDEWRPKTWYNIGDSVPQEPAKPCISIAQHSLFVSLQFVLDL